MVLLTTGQQALKYSWLRGESASDHDILPELKSFIAKARLRRGIEMVKLANRIEALKMRDDDPDGGDLPASSKNAAIEGVTAAGVAPPSGSGVTSGSSSSGGGGGGDGAPGRLAGAAKAAIFREVVLAKVREKKAEQEAASGRTTDTVKREERK